MSDDGIARNGSNGSTATDDASAASASGSASARTKKVVRVLEPLEAPKSLWYRCDTHFCVDALLASVDDENAAAYGFVVVDGSGALLARVQGNKFTVVSRLGDPSLPNKHRRGGQSAGRFFRNREIARSAYALKVAEEVAARFIDSTTSVPSVVGLVMAGSADLKDRVASRLDPRLAKMVLARIDVAYNGTAGLTAAITAAAPALKGVEMVGQQRACADLMSALERGDNTAAFGHTDTLAALEEGAARVLLLWDELPLIRHTIRYTPLATASASPSDSDDDDAEEPDEEPADASASQQRPEVVVIASPAEDPLALFASRNAPGIVAAASAEPDDSGAAGNNGSDTDSGDDVVTARLVSSARVVDSVPLLDHLIRHGRESGADSIVLISACTPEGSQFSRGFGGIAVLTRWAWTNEEAAALAPHLAGSTFAGLGGSDDDGDDDDDEIDLLDELDPDLDAFF